MKKILILLSILLFWGCSSFYYMEPIQNNELQQIEYIEGYPSIIDVVITGEEKGLIIQMYGYTSSDVIILEVLYANLTDNDIDVLPKNITVKGIKNDKTKEIKVWEANSYIRKVKRSQNLSLALQAISGTLDAQDAGKSTTTSSGYYSGSYNSGFTGSYSGYYNGTTTTYDRNKAEEARARNSASIRVQSEANKENIEYLNSVLLKATTLKSNMVISGSVYVKKEIFDKYHIYIPFGGNDFDFDFELIKEK
jgi:PBP1b-binding outer membrane lipoprotein LpoB